MNLQLASVWLQYTEVRFSDILEFSRRCRSGALESGRESAALLILAAKADAFIERYNGVPAADTAVTSFAASLLQDAIAMRDACEASADDLDGTLDETFDTESSSASALYAESLATSYRRNALASA